MSRVEYWLDLAEYDLKTAKAMLKSKRYLYVGFMCHQVVEKALKAFFVENLKTQPPYIHNLTRLAEKSGLYERLNETEGELRWIQAQL